MDKSSHLNEDMNQTTEILAIKYPQFNQTQLRNIIDVSPDELYAQWSVDQIAQGQVIWPEDKQRLDRAYAFYLDNKGRSEYQSALRAYGITHPKNILSYGLRDVEKLYPKDDNAPRTRSERARIEEIKRNGSAVYYDGPEGKILEIRTPQAMKIYAKGTLWCVSNEKVAENYLKDDFLYLFQIGNRKFLFHSGNEQDESQFMDEQDEVAQYPQLDDLIVASDFYQDFHSTAMQLSAPHPDMRSMGDPHDDFEYAVEIVKRRWIPGEETIKTNAICAEGYAREFLKERWPEAEDAIKQDPGAATNYAIWILEEPWPEAEKTIMTCGYAAAKYAMEVLRERWPEAEDIIMRQGRMKAFFYCEELIRGKWPEAEKYFLKDPHITFLYSIHILRKRWPEGERVLRNYPDYAKRYARHFGGANDQKLFSEIIRGR